MKTHHTLFIRLAIFYTVLAMSVSPQAADNKLKQTLTDFHAYNADWWIYNDLAKARAEAKRTGKPIFVTFRCVPCQACKSFDAEVANGSDVIKKLAKEKFISLRQVEMKGVDLNQFQFDYDLNWAAMFINADGVVYGRYGTQSADGPDAFNSIASLENAMHRVLDLHDNYPANKASLVGKLGKKKPYSTGLDMPGMENKSKLRAPTHRGNCIHCHMIHDAENLHAWRTGNYSKEMFWRYPYPNNLGIEIDPDDGRVIKSIQRGGAADKAGLKVGDEVMAVNGQAMTSIADFQWVLHNLPNTPVTVNVTTKRIGKTSNHKVSAKAGWKVTDISWRGSIWGMPPRIGIYMPKLKPNELSGAGLPRNTNASRVKWINDSIATAKSAKRSGLRMNDIVVGINNGPLPNDHRNIIHYIKMHFLPGQNLPLTVLRNGKRVKLSIPLKE